MKPLIVSAHTPDEFYTAAAARLQDSLKSHGLEHEIHIYQPRGSWMDNTFYKPFFIKSMLDKHPGRALIWLDADAEVVDYPALLFDLDCDFAAGSYKNQMLSGTMYFRNNEAVGRLLKQWLVELTQEPVIPGGGHPVIFYKEQYALGRAVDYLVKQGLLTVAQLPFEYVSIFDVLGERPPVILHHQLSRKGRQLYG